MNFLKKIVLLLILGALAGCASTSTGFGNRPDVQRFIQKVSVKDHFNEYKLTALFNQVHPRAVFVHHTVHAAETELTWSHYRAILITSSHIERGVAFWRAHEASLLEAQRVYGVSPDIIIGILGVETDYGKYPGKYRVIDSLSTLAFNYPRRRMFFQDELEQYLLLTRDLNLDPLSLEGSYAGAVGLPQFMPDSYRKLAVSHNGRVPDLWHSPDDAILSIANYFYHKGWRAGEPVALQVSRPTYNTVQFGDECWLLYPNFSVIKRYNDSNFYAMAVLQLGEAVRQQKERES